MLKKILAILALLYAAVSFAAVDVNKATAAELDGVKGIGPVISKTIIDERKKGGDFKSWDDFVARVKGIGDTKAANLSKEGLTVNGAEFKKAAAKDAKAEKKEEKKEAKADAKAAATDAKADAKTEKKEAKADVKAEAKKDAKAEKAEKKEAKKKEKEAKAKAEDTKKDDKAAAAKPAASAASAKK